MADCGSENCQKVARSGARKLISRPGFGQSVLENLYADPSWPVLNILDHSWPVWIISDQSWSFLTSPDHSWPVLIILDQTWPFLTSHDHSWSDLSLPDHFWPFPIIPYHSWSFLTIPADHSWAVQIISEIPNQNGWQTDTQTGRQNLWKLEVLTYLINLKWEDFKTKCVIICSFNSFSYLNFLFRNYNCLRWFPGCIVYVFLLCVFSIHLLYESENHKSHSKFV